MHQRSPGRLTRDILRRLYYQALDVPPPPSLEVWGCLLTQTTVVPRLLDVAAGQCGRDTGPQLHIWRCIGLVSHTGWSMAGRAAVDTSCRCVPGTFPTPTTGGEGTPRPAQRPPEPELQRLLCLAVVLPEPDVGRRCALIGVCVVGGIFWTLAASFRFPLPITDEGSRLFLLGIFFFAILLFMVPSAWPL